MLAVSLTAVPVAASAQGGAGADTLPADTSTAAEAGRTPAGETPRERLRVFLDCPRWLCDFDFFREEIPYVSWVRDRKVADVHVLVTEQRTGGGGIRISLDLLGRGGFDGLERRVTYTAPPSQADAETRRALVRRLRMGLVIYQMGTGDAERLRVRYEGAAEERETRERGRRDPWNRWVFDVDMGGSVNSEQTRTSFSFNGGVSANRTTRAWKIDIGVNGRYDESDFDLERGGTFTTVRRRWEVESLAVRSLGAHWSVGGQAGVTHSTPRNQDMTLRGGPALEYNLFPYEESTRRQLTFLYAVSGNLFDYRQTTVFGKTTDQRLSHSLTVSLDVQEAWGEAGVSLEGEHFLDDPGQNRLTLGGNLELQLFEGFSLGMFGSASRIRNQVYLPREEASDIQLVAGEREFGTDFEYFLRVGVSYTFGSIYSDVVNTRFEALGGGGGAIFF